MEPIEPPEVEVEDEVDAPEEEERPKYDGGAIPRTVPEAEPEE
jgi:hypothetical protein